LEIGPEVGVFRNRDRPDWHFAILRLGVRHRALVLTSSFSFFPFFCTVLLLTKFHDVEGDDVLSYLPVHKQGMS
jgi:hypothetical protein